MNQSGDVFTKLVILIWIICIFPFAYCQIDYNCTISSTNDKGLCMNLYPDCQPIFKAYLNGGTEQCSKENIYLSCCPFSRQFRKLGKRAAAACDFYQAKSNQVYAIYIGTEAERNEFPHMAALGYGGDENSIKWGCGGTLISKEHILTAAHCVNSQDFGMVTWARLGALNLKNTSDGTNIPIIERIIYPNYKKPLQYHDIAILKIKEIHLGLIKPACLHTFKSVNFSPLTAVGWGKIEFLGDQSPKLLKTNLNVVQHLECAKKYSTVNKKRLPNGIDDSTQVCAGDQQGNDACPGDSGGPLTAWVKGANEKLVDHYKLVGVTSFGKGCGGTDSAGVYTRVSAYTKWIENIVWPL